MKKYYIILVALAISQNLLADEWKIYDKPDYGKIIHSGKYLWAVGHRISRIDKQTGDVKFIDMNGEYLCKDSSENIWMKGDKLKRFNMNSGEWLEFEYSDIDTSLDISSAAVGPDNVLWLQSGNRFIKYNGSNFTILSIPGLPGIGAIDNNGAIWSSENIDTIIYLVKYYQGIITKYSMNNVINQDSILGEYIISKLIPDNNNNIWFSVGLSFYGLNHTGERLYKFDGNEFSYWTIEDTSFISGLKSLSIDNIDRTGNIYVTVSISMNYTTISNYTFLFDGENFLKYDIEGTSESPKFQFEDDDGIHWFMANDYIYYDGSDYKIIPKSDDICPFSFNYLLPNVREIIIDEHFTAYIRIRNFIPEFMSETYTTALYVIKDKIFELINSEIPITDMAMDSKNNIWIGGKDKIARLNGNDFEYQQIPIKTWSVPYFDGEKMVNVTQTKYLSGLQIDPFDNIWIIENYEDSYTGFGGSSSTISGNGIFKKTKNEIIHYNKELPYAGISEIAFSRDGTVWLNSYEELSGSGIGGIGTGYYNGGIIRIKEDKIEVIDTNQYPYLPSNCASLMKTDSKNNLWVHFKEIIEPGLFGGIGKGLGIGKYSEPDWKFYDTIVKVLPSNDIVDMIIDSLDRVWVICRVDNDDGQNEKYLITVLLTENSWHIFDEPEDTITFNDFGAGYIHSSGLDGKNNLWVGTSEGLYKYSLFGDNQKYTEDNSKLPGNYVGCLAIDKNDNLWLDCEYGFAIFNEESIKTSAVNEKKIVNKLNLSLHPNPTAELVTTNYELRNSGHVSLILYDILGNERAMLIDKYQSAGRYNYEFRISNYELEAGVYFLKLEAGGTSAARKLIIDN